MIKRLGMLAASFALAALPAWAVFTPLAASAACPTGVTATTCATASFAISATVSPTATLTFGSGGTFTQYTWGGTNPITDISTQFLAADNDPVNTPTISPTINASIRTSAGNGGAGAIFFVTPTTSTTTVPGANGSIPIGAFSYGCSGSYQPSTPAGGSPPSAVNITNTTTSPTAIVSGSNTGCGITFGSGVSVASSNIQLSLYLDDRNVAADTYTLSGFQVVVSAS
jgi:hypothetical protein